MNLRWGVDEGVAGNGETIAGNRKSKWKGEPNGKVNQMETQIQECTNTHERNEYSPNVEHNRHKK